MGYDDAMRYAFGHESPVRVGDVFYTTWGYDQTNVDLIQVVEVSPTGKTVTARMMGKRVVRHEMGADYVVPGDAVGESFRLVVRRASDGGARLVGSYPFAQGSKRSGSFAPWHMRPIYETGIGWGH